MRIPSLATSRLLVTGLKPPENFNDGERSLPGASVTNPDGHDLFGSPREAR